MKSDELKTLKAAKDAELKTKEEWLKYTEQKEGEYPLFFCPRVDAMPIRIKGKEFFSREDCELCISKSEASRRGLSVHKGTEAVTERYSSTLRGYFDLYRISDCKPKRVQQPPKMIDILLATFTVNKAAKRYRDAASSQYRGRRHGLSGHASDFKEHLYDLKDVGIAIAYHESRIQFVGIHGNFVLYSGEGYSFHSTLIPKNISSGQSIGEDDNVFIEAAPKGAGEAKLRDAIFTLENLTNYTNDFTSLSAPEFETPRRRHECHIHEDVYESRGEDNNKDEWNEEDEWETEAQL